MNSKLAIITEEGETITATPNMNKASKRDYF